MVFLVMVFLVMVFLVGQWARFKAFSIPSSEVGRLQAARSRRFCRSQELPLRCPDAESQCRNEYRILTRAASLFLRGHPSGCQGSGTR